jgi:YD repeat-containing protein
MFWFSILGLVAAFKHRTLRRWWQAWDERGRPVDVEVLPPAPITERGSKQ